MASARQTILVVEDEALLLFSVADDLREKGFTVLEASNAEKALSILASEGAIDALFTDVDMPGRLDGIGLSSEVNQLWPQVRILITSGKQLPAAASALAAYDFLPKPYSTAKVAESLRSLLGSPRA